VGDDAGDVLGPRSGVVRDEEASLAVAVEEHGAHGEAFAHLGQELGHALDIVLAVEEQARVLRGRGTVERNHDVVRSEGLDRVVGGAPTMVEAGAVADQRQVHGLRR
jgi:hypothetical protein